MVCMSRQTNLIILKWFKVILKSKEIFQEIRKPRRSRISRIYKRGTWATSGRMLASGTLRAPWRTCRLMSLSSSLQQIILIELIIFQKMRLRAGKKGSKADRDHWALQVVWIISSKSKRTKVRARIKEKEWIWDSAWLAKTFRIWTTWTMKTPVTRINTRKTTTLKMTTTWTKLFQTR